MILGPGLGRYQRNVDASITHIHGQGRDQGSVDAGSIQIHGQGRDQGNVNSSIIQTHGQGRETERSEDGLGQFRVVLTPVRVPHIEGKNTVKTKTTMGKDPRARSGERNDVKRRRRKKRSAHIQLTNLVDDF